VLFELAGERQGEGVGRGVGGHHLGHHGHDCCVYHREVQRAACEQLLLLLQALERRVQGPGSTLTLARDRLHTQAETAPPRPVHRFTERLPARVGEQLAGKLKLTWTALRPSCPPLTAAVEALGLQPPALLVALSAVNWKMSISTARRRAELSPRAARWTG